MLVLFMMLFGQFTYAGTGSAATFRQDYSVTPVTTSAWTKILTAPVLISSVEIFDSSGQVLRLGVGPVGAEVSQFYITPGGNGLIPFKIEAGQVVSIQAVTANATSGQITVNFYNN